MNLTRRELLLGATTAIGLLGRAQAQPQEAPRISAQEALKLVASGEAVVVDVRDRLAWEGSHAEGALSVPSSEIGKRLAELPKDKLIAAYCT